MYTRRDRRCWERLVRAFESSGVRQQVFCERRGLALGTFQRWLYKIRHERDASDSASTALVRVHVDEPTAATDPVEASLPSGVVLRFATGTDPRYVASLVAQVEQARC